MGNLCSSISRIVQFTVGIIDFYSVSFQDIKTVAPTSIRNNFVHTNKSITEHQCSSKKVQTIYYDTLKQISYIEFINSDPIFWTISQDNVEEQCVTIEISEDCFELCSVEIEEFNELNYVLPLKKDAELKDEKISNSSSTSDCEMIQIEEQSDGLSILEYEEVIEEIEGLDCDNKDEEFNTDFIDYLNRRFVA